MNYELFKESILQQVKQLYPYAEVTINKINKNNGVSFDNLHINNSNSRVVPCIYLDQYYIQYQRGLTIKTIVSEILSKYEFGNSSIESLHTNPLIYDFADFTKIKNRIVFKLINFEKNRELLEVIPHTKFLDLAIVYMFLAQEGTDTIGIIQIRNEHLDLWKISKEEIHSFAMQNTQRLMPESLNSLTNVVQGLMSEFEISKDLDVSNEADVYVLTNQKGINGAGTMLYPEVLSSFSSIYCKNIDSVYILPSSVHEVLLVPVNVHYDAKQIQQMVEEVNQTQVPKEEILSDNVYVYLVKENKIYLQDTSNKMDTCGNGEGEVIQCNASKTSRRS